MPPADRLRPVAVTALLGTCVLWGTSFATVKTCGEILGRGAAKGLSPFSGCIEKGDCPSGSAQEGGRSAGDPGPAFGPLLLTALRFTVALPIVLLFWRGRRSWGRGPQSRCIGIGDPRLGRGQLPALLKVALPMTAGFVIQAISLGYTTATVSAFLTSLVVLCTPFLEWIVLGRRTTRRLAVAVALAVAAVALMALPGRPGPAFGLGEALSLVCVAAYSFQVLWTGQGADRVGPGVLTFGSFAIVAGTSWLILLAAWPTHIPAALAAAAVSPTFLWLFALLVLGATVGAMALMNSFQRYVRPTEASVIYTTEPVFAAVFAWLVRGRAEALGLWGLVGAGLMLVADLLAAARIGEKRPPPAARLSRSALSGSALSSPPKGSLPKGSPKSGPEG